MYWGALKIKKGIEWEEFHNAMNETARTNVESWRPLFDFISTFDSVFTDLIDRSTAIEGERPQDYVALILATRSFRLAIGGLTLAVSGYQDLVPNLLRTIWEINIRLIYMKRDPVKLAMGYLLHSAYEKINGMESGGKYYNETEKRSSYFYENLRINKDYYGYLERIAQNHGLNPKSTRKKYEKMKVAKMCKDLGIKIAYDIAYSHYCGFVHERNLATNYFMKETNNSRVFEAGPVDRFALETSKDTLKHLGMVLEAVADLVEDQQLTEKIKGVLIDLDLADKRVKSGVDKQDIV